MYTVHAYNGKTDRQEDLVFQILNKWKIYLQKRKSRKDPATQEDPQPVLLQKKDSFSPLTYRNPLIIYMHLILEHVLACKNLACRNMELVVIDAEDIQDEDDNDIQLILDALERRLNYLLLVTDRPDSYQRFMDEMYEENGLIVQQIPKSARRQARGNVILDFERNSGYAPDHAASPEAIYMPIYKRPWEIRENLDILVPVGYNTLVVEGILPPEWNAGGSINERFIKDRMTDRLDREFRKG